MRISTYRKKILEILKDTHLLSIAAIHKNIPEADFSTVFRNLEHLCLKGIVKRVFIDKDLVLYELFDVNHPHDHFFCVHCGMIESLEARRDIISDKLLHTTVIDIIVRGICKHCTK